MKKFLATVTALGLAIGALAQTGFKNSAGNVLPHVITLASNDVFMIGATGSPISPTNKNVRAGQLLALLENISTNYTLRVGNGVGYVILSNYVASGIPSMEWNLFTGTNAFVWNIGDASGRKGKLYVNTIHNGSNANDDHNVEWQWQSPAHIAYGVGYGYGNNGHFQWGIGAANTNNGGVWGYQQAQRDLSGSIPWGYSGADTFRVNWKSNSATFNAYPGLIGEAFGTDDYALTFLANLFNDWIDSASGSDQWRPDTMVRAMLLHRGGQTNWLEVLGDVRARGDLRSGGNLWFTNFLFATVAGGLKPLTTLVMDDQNFVVHHGGDDTLLVLPGSDTVWVGGPARNIDFLIRDNSVGGNNAIARLGTFYSYIGKTLSVGKQENTTNATFEVNGSAQVDKLYFTNLLQVLTGTGSPEGVVTAKVGSLYTRDGGGAGTTLYVKESGTGNTGWVAK